MKAQRRFFAPLLSPWEQRYFKVLILLVLLPTAAAVTLVYYLVWQNVASEIAIPEAIARFLIPAFEKTNRSLLVGLPVVFGGMFIYASILMNRRLGPFPRIERELSEMAQRADFSRRLTIRKKDAPRPLIDSINRLLSAAE